MYVRLLLPARALVPVLLKNSIDGGRTEAVVVLLADLSCDPAAAGRQDPRIRPFLLIGPFPCQSKDIIDQCRIRLLKGAPSGTGPPDPRGEILVGLQIPDPVANRVSRDVVLLADLRDPAIPQ